LLEPLCHLLRCRGISSQAKAKSLEGSTTTFVMVLDQEEHFLLSCLLGDGWLSRQSSNNFVIGICHTASQLPWLKYKAERIASITGSKASIRPREWVTKGVVYHGYEYIAGCSKFKHLYSMLYKNNTKTFSKSLLKLLGPEAAAFFWCDDGCVHKRVRDKANRPNPTVELQGCLALYEPLDQAKNVSEWLFDLFNIKTWQVYHSPSDSYQVRLGGTALRTLKQHIDPYIPDCMSWKLDLSLPTQAERALILKERAIRRQECAATLVVDDIV